MATRTLKFSQVDVFAEEMHYGNPVAVVHDADELSDDAMAAFARWTNLSETTFLLSPTRPEADYRLRIFTPGGELPFAGHPTLGSCHAWLSDNGDAVHRDRIVQECGIGLVEVRRLDGALAFAAPERLRTGLLDADLLDQICAACGLTRDDVLEHQWVDNGPGWCAIRLASAEAVLAVKPDMAALGKTCLGLVGPYENDDAADFEVRAFVPDMGVPEDPVTGSLNASIGQWLMETGVAPQRYVASQGTAIGRRGRIRLTGEGDQLWVSGATRTSVAGTVEFDA
ncbi:MAG: PhzF family phenazine biosynthesis protein [Pseudomonadota bacterium]